MPLKGDPLYPKNIESHSFGIQPIFQLLIIIINDCISDNYHKQLFHAILLNLKNKKAMTIQPFLTDFYLLIIEDITQFNLFFSLCNLFIFQKRIRLHFNITFPLPWNLNLQERMGCQTSQISNFVNSLADDNPQQPNNAGNQRPPQQNPQYPQQYGNPQPQTYGQQPVYNQPPQQYPPQQQQYPPQHATNSQPQYNQQAVGKVGAASGPTGIPVKKKKAEPREYLEPHANIKDDFITHHLRYELSLCRYVTAKRIKRRQILEHITLQKDWGNIGGKDINILAYFETANSAWMQRTFLDIWEDAHNDFFNKDVEEKVVRRKVAEQYMFELYQIKEFVDSGLGNLNALIEKTRTNLYEFSQASDDALFNIFKKLKDRYPQTGETQKIEFPDVPSTKTKENLFNNFKSKCFSDPDHINIQTIYDDVSFLLNKAFELKDPFKEDMKDILGDDVLACPKVNLTMKDTGPEFNACAVRRVFVKWAENLLELFPELLQSKPFLKFIQAKARITNNFFFKSTIQESTHKIVIDIICQLIEVAKYNLKDQSKRKEFLFNIYDLLRCKVKKPTAEKVVELLRKMESTKVTKSGQKFEVLRVKNRFKTNNRDLLINFRYGDVIVGEAQLCIDTANVSKLTKHNYEFCHYIYELERSLFGPTLQLMMQYEDFQRPDISVSFEAEGLVYRRGDQTIQSCEKSARKCLNGHEMNTLVGNYFFGDDPNQHVSASCNFCDRMTDSSIPYDYCFYCSCFLCKQCQSQQAKFDRSKIWLSIQRQELAVSVTSAQSLNQLCSSKKTMIVLFYLQGQSPSEMFKDSLLYHQSKLSFQPGKFVPNISLVNATRPNGKNLAKYHKITQFPSLVLLNNQGQAVRTIIGYSFLEMPFIYETQKRMINGQSIELQLICVACQENLQFKVLPEGNLLCLSCFNNNKPINIPENYKNIGGFCPSEHYRCISCSYSGSDVPSFYKDETGSCYLASPQITLKMKKCPKGHVPVLTKVNILGMYDYQCYGCKRKYLFDDETGVGICQPCKIGLCPACMGVPYISLKDDKNSSSLALHYAESTAEEGCLCICSKHFKKVYKSRNLSVQQLQNQLQVKLQPWKCLLCRNQYQQGELHIACFACPVISQAIGQKFNFQICMKCANQSQILMRQTQLKAKEQFSFMICTKGHQTVKTSLIYNNSLTFDCNFCKNKYYGHTERFYCKTCQTSCCIDCVQELIKLNSPVCKQKCKQNHGFNYIYKPKSLQFCDLCRHVLQSSHFKCASGCDYALCLDCAYDPTKQSMKKIQYEEQEQQNFNLLQLLNAPQQPQQPNNENDFDQMDFFG